MGARWGVRTAAPPWVVARVVTLGALGVAHELESDGRLTAKSAMTVHEGLLAWDAGWYEAIAKHGYGGAGAGSLRFFPLMAGLARALSEIPGIPVSAALLVVANLSALGAAAAIACLVRHETGDTHLARRAAWLLCLAPPAFVFVMGYAEATFVLLCVGAFFALRLRRWWTAAGLSVLAGLARPFGALLCLPAIVECARAWYWVHPTSFARPSSRWRRLSQVAAIAGGPVGSGAFLAWCGWRYHDAFAPLSIQEEPSHRGGPADPLKTLAHDASLLVHGQHLGTALHLPWVLLAIALLVVASTRLPSSYAVFAFAILAVALTASNLDSFERYALSAFPLVVAAAGFVRTQRQETVLMVVAAAGLVCYSVLAFTGLYVP
jgi:Mannosyltransferase (PIG-V)